MRDKRLRWAPLCFNILLRHIHLPVALYLLRHALFFQPPHSQVFKDAILDFLQVIVILVKHLPRAWHIDLLACTLAPGQARQQFQVGADDAVFG